MEDREIKDGKVETRIILRKKITLMVCLNDGKKFLIEGRRLSDEERDISRGRAVMIEKLGRVWGFSLQDVKEVILYEIRKSGAITRPFLVVAGTETSPEKKEVGGGAGR